MKLYRVTRNYRTAIIADVVFASCEEEVYAHMGWGKFDNPKLEIKEIEIRPGCVMNFSIPAPGSRVFDPNATMVTWGWHP